MGKLPGSNLLLAGFPLIIRLLLPVLIVFLTINTSAQSAYSDATEQRISSHVDGEMHRAISLLEQAVNINSGSMNFAGVRKVGALMAQEFKQLGFETRWVDGESFGRAGHLVASREGSGPKVLLIGHLDTVFPVTSDFQKFEIFDEHYARGPGTTDMKGGDVVMIQAMRALSAVGVLNDISLKVVMTGDEEKSGNPKRLRSAALVDAGKWADYAIGFEDGDGDPETAVIARRGSSGWRLEVSGTRAHSSQIFQPEFGDGAIYEAARILHSFQSRLESLTDLTYNPGLILGGTNVEHDAAANSGTAFGKGNVIASSVLVTGDLRAVSIDQLKQARKVMREVVAQHLPKTGATIEFMDGYPPMSPSDGNYKLLALYNEVSKDLGFGEVLAVNPRKAGAADISFVANDVAMAMDGVGLMGKGGHTLDEIADLRTFAPQTKRIAVLLYRLTQLDQ